MYRVFLVNFNSAAFSSISKVPPLLIQLRSLLFYLNSVCCKKSQLFVFRENFSKASYLLRHGPAAQEKKRKEHTQKVNC